MISRTPVPSRVAASNSNCDAFSGCGWQVLNFGEKKNSLCSSGAFTFPVFGLVLAIFLKCRPSISIALGHAAGPVKLPG